MEPTIDLARLRNTLRAKRRALSRQVQTAHSQAVLGHLFHSGLFLRCDRIALYLASDGELDPSSIAKAGFESSKKVYLPVLRGRLKRALWFCEYRPGDSLFTNRFGISEPDIRKRTPVPPWGLDLILMPLVGFDNRCNRLGMGGGFYDRTLAYLRLRTHWRKPLLVGMAHQCQHTPQITARPWDIPLDAVLSENGLSLPGKKKQ